jgi:hypothetical protein
VTPHQETDEQQEEAADAQDPRPTCGTRITH